MQVQLAFVAGLVVVLLLIPINRWLAQQIQVASIAMMAAKDTRLSILQVWVPSGLNHIPITQLMYIRAFCPAATCPDFQDCCQRRSC